MTIHLDAIAVSVISGTILSIGGIMFAVIRNYLKKAERQRLLTHIEVQSMSYGLMNVNHGFKDDFTPKYKERYEFLMEQHKFINDN